MIFRNDDWMALNSAFRRRLHGVWGLPQRSSLNEDFFAFLLKARGKLRPEWTAKLLDDGSLAVRDKVYSIPHIAILLLRKIKGKAYEYEVVVVVLILQGVIAIYTLYSFYAP
ncbi:MAG: hypothetical protein Q8O41_08235 [Candidatus Methanoperedens sp.]|nr:hypothetical protein [Candidatus Methanoperedens sp.]